MSNIFQSPEWEQLKLKTGYAKSYRIDDILVLQKNLPLGFSMLYSPMLSQDQRPKTKDKSFLEKIREIGQQNNSIFYRAEFDIPVLSHQSLDFRPFVKSFEEMQPEHTLILDLTKNEDEILSQMKQKGRYNIKVAQKNNLIIEKTSVPNFEIEQFYQLYSATSKRHGITFRGIEYFKSLLEILGKSGYALLYTAYLDQRLKTKDQRQETIDQSPQPQNPSPKSQVPIPLASAIIIYSGNKAIYLYGASSSEHKNLMAPYKLHFDIIKESKSRGCTEYDFFGIAPDDSSSHPWAGVTRFKKQFGGTERQIAGSYDLIFKPTMYQMFKIAEKIRRK